MGAVDNQVARAAVALTLLLLGGGCRSKVTPAAPVSFATALLTAGRDLEDPPAEETKVALRELERIAGEAREALARPDRPSVAEVLNTIVFDDEAFVREVEKTDTGFVLLPSVLRGRRGNCVGLGSLYLALGELLHVPVRGVVMPGHFFVRIWERDRWRNVELLRRGEEMPDEWYRWRWPPPGVAAPAYGRLLTNDEALGVIEYDVGNESRRQGQIGAARRFLGRAVAHFPGLPEAEASLGAVLHLIGSLDGAASAYQAAKQASPQLPGLDDNIRLLNDERARQSPRR
jgi:Transglutaminase-like superfamily